MVDVLSGEELKTPSPNLHINLLYEDEESGKKMVVELQASLLVVSIKNPLRVFLTNLADMFRADLP